MSQSEIKIFYSWQSDLPGNQTRSVIQESIESVVKTMKDTVEIIADRDTKGEYGSPDIVETIFKKIDECDIFIADVSIINRYYPIDEEGQPIEAVKTTPNPNVLIELGYAAHVVGWENIICILNTDFGKIDELPFDIRQRRLTPYSLKERKKPEVRKTLRDIIAATVMNIQEKGPRVKGVFSNHIVGAYDSETKDIVKQLIPFDIANSECYKKERSVLLDKCKKLITVIKEIEIQPIKEKQVPLESPKKTEGNKLFNDFKFSTVNINTEVFKKMVEYKTIIIEEDTKKHIIKKMREWFDIELSEDFFFLGELQFKNVALYGQPSEYIGTENEKRKIRAIHELEVYMYELEVLDLYIETFKGLYLFPLAIGNISSQQDSNITVSVNVDDNSAEFINPTKELINEDLKGLEGIVYESEIMKRLLMMPESTDISYDTDISYTISDSFHQMRHNPISILGESTPKYDSDDYERELKKYIASPLNIHNYELEFEISDLRAKEKKWIGGLIAVKAKGDKISLSYNIKSQNSSGELSGRIEYII